MAPVIGSPSAHVLLVPLPRQGHMTPFVSLANYLAASGISVTLVHTERAHALLSHTQEEDDSSTAMKLPIRIEVVPDGIMPTDPKQPISMGKFRESDTIIRKGVEELLQKLIKADQPPCCLIIDNLIGWGPDVSVKFGLPWMMLCTGSASIFSIGYHVPELAAKGYLPAVDDGSKDKIVDFIPGLSPFRIRDLPKSLKVEEDPQTNPTFQLIRSMYSSAKHANRVLINSLYELESSAVEALHKEAGIHMVPVGPLFIMGSLSSSSATSSLLQEDDSCLSWLDQQQESSVLYISFGSVVSIEGDAIGELAHGLEASGLNFLWVIRTDSLSDKASVQELLPEGFMERTHDRGRIISWAPQLAVLGHSAVGAFLTHCGWNSVIESLCNGVPMLGFPQLAEQNTNLKFIVHDWKVGFPLLPPNVQQVQRSHLQHALTELMRGDEGAEVRKNALRWKEIALKACSGSSKANLEKIVADLNSWGSGSSHRSQG